MNTVFLRVLEASVDQKPKWLLDMISEFRGAAKPSDNIERLIFERGPSIFRFIPGSAIAYWAPRRCFQVFTERSSSDRHRVLVVSTNPLNLDFRYARLWFEPSHRKVGHAWRPWAKGGEFSPHYFDVPTVIAWSESARSYPGFLGTENRPLQRPASVQHFFRPGLTWPRRTQSGLGMRVMPAGCIFGDKGPAAFVDSDSSEELLALLAITTSAPFRYLVELQMAFGSYEVGVIQRTPVPHATDADTAALAQLARRAWSLKRSRDTINETSHAFLLPSGLNERVTGLNRSAGEHELLEIQQQIDEHAFRLYDIEGADREQIEAWAKRGGSASGEDGGSNAEEDDGDDAPVGAPADTLLSWLVGVVFGRFDPRLATGERAIPSEPEPFDPVPKRSPGMWPESELSPITPPDILVDDPGHDDDIGAQVASAAAKTGCPDPMDLRQWLAREFFPLHIRMYSKSRRKAPIYWQLATPSASYSVWLYIHAFSKDSLFRVQNDYVGGDDGKLAQEERRLAAMQADAAMSSSAVQRRAIDAQERFIEELRTFLDEVKRVAPLWNPDLDDGVIINFAPLWRLVPQHRAWQRELKATWDALCDGKYAWAHLALHLWPERVVPKCATDRSLAIAHGLEDVFWVEGADGKWTARSLPTRPIEELVRERTSPAVKAALKSLIEAPDAGIAGQGRRQRRRR